MSVTLRTNFGTTEAVLADDGTLSLFYHIAHIVSKDLKIRFVSKQDDIDTVSWVFRYRGQTFTLHYDMYNGISILPSVNRDTTKDNKALAEMAGLVGRKLDATAVARKMA